VVGSFADYNEKMQIINRIENFTSFHFHRRLSESQNKLYEEGYWKDVHNFKKSDLKSIHLVRLSH
jgi:hypothetical protein